jgi:hypothetical protein
MPPRGRGLWIVAGVLAGLLLHGVGGWWTPTGFAQSTNTTTTTTTTGSSVFNSPPDCGPVGSSGTSASITTTTTFGPETIFVGVNQSQSFFVAAGTMNIDTHTHTTTFFCVAAVPALPWPTLLGLGGVLSGLGMWRLRARRAGSR